MAALSDSDMLFYQIPYKEYEHELAPDLPPTAPPPCACSDNAELFETYTVVYCPYHGQAPLIRKIARGRKKIRKLYSSNQYAEFKRPPANCANGFIVTFENLEELFLKPKNTKTFFTKTLPEQLFAIIETINLLEQRKVYIFGKTTHKTRTTYFELVQTPLDVNNKLTWVPLGPANSEKLIVKHWLDRNGHIVCLVMKKDSFKPQLVECPLNDFSKTFDSQLFAINNKYDAPLMEVTFIGIRNPWYFSRAVPGNNKRVASARTDLSQVRENHLTSTELKKFESVLMSLPLTPNDDNIHWTHSKIAGSTDQTFRPVGVSLQEFKKNYLGNLPYFNIPDLEYVIPPILLPYLQGQPIYSNQVQAFASNANDVQPPEEDDLGLADLDYSAISYETGQSGDLSDLLDNSNSSGSNVTQDVSGKEVITLYLHDLFPPATDSQQPSENPSTLQDESQLLAGDNSGSTTTQHQFSELTCTYDSEDILDNMEVDINNYLSAYEAPVLSLPPNPEDFFKALESIGVTGNETRVGQATSTDQNNDPDLFQAFDDVEYTDSQEAPEDQNNYSGNDSSLADSSGVFDMFK